MSGIFFMSFHVSIHWVIITAFWIRAMWLFHASSFLPPVEIDVSGLVASASTVCDLSILFGVTMFAMAGTYTVQLAWAQRGDGGWGSGRAGYRSAPWGGYWQTRNIRTDLGKQCQRGAWECPAAREQPCSRAASQNALLTANLQTRKSLAAGHTSACGLLLWLYSVHMTSQS